jgi:predicted DNA-binding transcriptional regulator AlpA
VVTIDTPGDGHLCVLNVTGLSLHKPPSEPKRAHDGGNMRNPVTQTSPNDPGNRVRSFREAAAAAGISLATLRRRIADGTGPRVVRVSVRRVGIRDRDFAAWLDQCAGD